MKTGFVVACAFLVVGCGGGSTEPAVPTATGPDASVVVTVDCGDDGVANVTLKYGSGEDRKVLVGDNPTTLGFGGGVATLSEKFGTAEGFPDAELTVITSPTRGTCKTVLTDYKGGAVLAERETAGEITLKAVVPALPS